MRFIRFGSTLLRLDLIEQVTLHDDGSIGFHYAGSHFFHEFENQDKATEAFNQASLFLNAEFNTSQAGFQKQKFNTLPPGFTKHKV